MGVVCDQPGKSSEVTGNMGEMPPDILVTTIFNYVSTMCTIQTLSPTAHSKGGQLHPNGHNLQVQNFYLNSRVPFDSQLLHNLSRPLKGLLKEISLGGFFGVN
jgi:hypothetical protein